MIKIKSIITLGIDQGVANCGYCVLEKTEIEERILTMGTIETTSSWTMGKRLHYIKEHISNLLTTYEPFIIGCEKLFFNPPQNLARKMGFRNKSASIMYTNMSTAMISLCSYEHSIDYEEISPPTIKKQITGNGRATKEEIEFVISEQFNEFLFKDVAIINQANNLILFEDIKRTIDEHTFDAVAIALTVARKHFNIGEE